MAREFIPDDPQQIPIVVSVREKKIATIDLTDWINEGEILEAADVTPVLRTRYGDDIANAATVSGTPEGSVIRIAVDWTKTARAQEYYLWVLYTKSGRKEDGYLRFRTHAI